MMSCGAHEKNNKLTNVRRNILKELMCSVSSRHTISHQKWPKYENFFFSSLEKMLFTLQIINHFFSIKKAKEIDEFLSHRGYFPTTCVWKSAAFTFCVNLLENLISMLWLCFIIPVMDWCGRNTERERRDEKRLASHFSREIYESWRRL